MELLELKISVGTHFTLKKIALLPIAVGKKSLNQGVCVRMRKTNRCKRVGLQVHYINVHFCFVFQFEPYQ